MARTSSQSLSRATFLLLMVVVTAAGMPSQGAIAAVPSDLAVLLAKDPTAKLPEPLVNALRQDLSKQTGVPAKKLRVVEAAPKTWSNGCLELAKADEMCTQALVNGWRVVMTNGTRRWIYRTDASGKVFRLEPATVKPGTKSRTLPLKPMAAAQIPANELPSKLERGVVFRMIASGGFIGRTYQTTLMNDGRVIRVQLNPNGVETAATVSQISPTQLREFQQTLKRYSLHRFHRQNYPAAPGSADFITVTLLSNGGAVRYSDSVQQQLPQNLQAIVQAWNELTRTV